jgi:hypothetical protein
MNVGPLCQDATLVDEDVLLPLPFTNTPLLCIEGSKLNDCTDAGIEGWGITLKDEAGAVVGTTTTDVNGAYSFCDLEPGNYVVEEEARDDWTSVGETSIPVELVCEDMTGNNFSNTPLICIDGYKYNFADDSGIPGWEITLKDASGAVIGTAMTDADGKYSFCDLEPGTYTVCEEEKDGWTPVGDTCIEVETGCEDSCCNNFYNEQSGCTLTPGYWKTHSIYGPAPYDDTWAELPEGEDTAFFLSGQSWYQVINNGGNKGNAYYQLSFQYIAAVLNNLQDIPASTPPEVAMAMDDAEYLFSTYTPAQIQGLKGNDLTRARFIYDAGILSKFNAGEIGPGHCDDEIIVI